MAPAPSTEPGHPDDPDLPFDPQETEPGDPAAAEAGERGTSLEGLSVAGITRRRAAFVLLALVTIWVVAVFARQVGDAAAATSRADAIRADNGALTTTVAALQAELQLIQKQEYVQQQARAYGLGTPQERAFTLAPDPSPLASDAPGSAAVRLGAVSQARSPLETWLSLLFGPDPSR
jgi:cell division protein FtsB